MQSSRGQRRQAPFPPTLLQTQAADGAWREAHSVRPGSARPNEGDRKTGVTKYGTSPMASERVEDGFPGEAARSLMCSG